MPTKNKEALLSYGLNRLYNVVTVDIGTSSYESSLVSGVRQ